MIVEVIQGPCVGNQTHFALNTEVLETINRAMRRNRLMTVTRGKTTKLKVLNGHY